MGVCTRFAPSPTGYLHLGNVWVAFINWLWTRQHQGKLILRIEDIDTNRCKTEYISALQEDLEWLGLDWDEGPGDFGAYGEPIQSKRHFLYQKVLKKWELENEIYPCFCTRARIRQISSAPHLGEAMPTYDGHCRNLSAADRETQWKDPSWRIKMEDEKISFSDMFCGTQSKMMKKGRDDFVIFRADGLVSYQLASSLDDGEMAVTHVFRGNDLLSSTFYQIYILKKSGYQIPVYGHLPLLVDKDGIRLSKRQQGITIRDLRRSGSASSEIIGMLLYWAGAIKKPMNMTAHETLKNIPFESCEGLGQKYIKISD